MGSRISRLTVCLPKKRLRCRANAASDPSTRAIAVASNPTLMLCWSASTIPLLSFALFHHSRVNSCGGHENVTSALNELMTTTTNGT